MENYSLSFGSAVITSENVEELKALPLWWSFINSYDDEDGYLYLKPTRIQKEGNLYLAIYQTEGYHPIPKNDTMDYILKNYSFKNDPDLIIGEDALQGMLYDLHKKPDENELTDLQKNIVRKFKKIKNREYYLKSKAKLEKKGFSENQIKKFFNCKNAGWKYEMLELKLELINSSAYPIELFKELSEANSNTKFDKIAKNWGLNELCSFSHPRKTSYARLIYKLK